MRTSSPPHLSPSERVPKRRQTRTLSPTDRLAERLLGKKSRAVSISGVSGGERGCLLACLRERGVSKFVCITATDDQAAELAEELRLFLGSGGADAVLEIPEEPLTPYDLPASRARERAAERLRTLAVLARKSDWSAVVLSAPALARRTVPRACFALCREKICTGEALDRDVFLRELSNLGFVNVPLVEDPGAFAARGSIVDVFSPMCESPARIEFFGDEVESIRLFDPETQRAFSSVKELLLAPARELTLTQDERERGSELILRLSDELTLPPDELSAILDDIQRGVLPPGLTGILPGFFKDGLETVFDYIPPDAAFFIDDPLAVDEALDAESSSLMAGFLGARERGELALPPDAHALGRGEILTRLQNFPLIRAEHLVVEGTSSSSVRSRIAFDFERWESAFPDEDDKFGLGGLAGLQTKNGSEPTEGDKFSAALSRWERCFRKLAAEGFYVAIAAASEAQAEKLRRIFEGRGLKTALIPGPIPTSSTAPESASSAKEKAQPSPGDDFQLHLHLGALTRGFIDRGRRIAIAAESEILGTRHTAASPRKRRQGQRKTDRALLQIFQNLKAGDLIVHTDYGIGRYEGLKRMTFGGMEGDVMVIQYAGGDRVYLPVSRLRLIQKFNGAKAEETPLDRLGGISWEKRKKAVKENLLRMAADLLKVEAARRAHPGWAFPESTLEMTRFEAAFPFDETPDQKKAIEAVLADMRSPVPMDRLVCGDVGFGKTEVAMRAAFQAILGGKQVAVLVPTTILASQHLLSFRERFRGEPVRIEMLTRLRSPKENSAVREAAQKGEIDILIGTHGLLSSGLTFKNLGLLIIDEEHRFGVAHKERIKRLKQTLDVLTLTATPIPRTLNLALSGLRQMSLIATPPCDRKPIRTFVIQEDQAKVAEIIRRELKRGGQVFFLHNRVETLEAKRREIQALVPEARCALAHGQMEKGALEKVMASFAARRTDVLLCSSIIESGLDIPTANTILVERADTFGLSQLYQIRGRVGRGSERAYAYLMIPAHMPLKRDARMRLEALQGFTELGSGFHIAARDLEIRGAGNLLGRDQSGQVAAVGFDLYCQLLEQAVSELKGEPIREEIDPEVELPVPAFFPEDYMPDIGLRLSFYKRMSDAPDDAELQGIKDELKDRFGPIPPEAESLFSLMGIKVRLRQLSLRALKASASGISLTLSAESGISPQKLIRYVQSGQGRRRLTPQMKLVASFSVPSPTASELFEDCHRILDDIEGIRG